jgi:hypothetical protein
MTESEEKPQTISKSQESGQGGGQTTQNNNPGENVEFRAGETPK